MAVTNRGSILISTANDIGSSLVDVIGGEGYTPNEWSKKINLCGIAAADVPTALENIEESTPSGTDRGSISLDTANAVGAVLNKKFNTARGFKPSEWASAISKLTELEVKTASGSVASFDDGADDVPLKSCTCEIVPQQDLHGYANPWAPGAGKNKANIFAIESCSNRPGNITQNNDGSITVDTTTQQNVKSTQKLSDFADLVVGETYTLSAVSTGSQKLIYLHEASTTWNFGTSKTITQTMLDSYVSFYASGNNTSAKISDLQLEIGSSATSWTPYSNICPITGTTEIEVTHTDGQNPPIESETKTAALGRTVLGGSYDFISGVLTEGYGVLNLLVSDMDNSDNYPGWRNCGIKALIGADKGSISGFYVSVGNALGVNTNGSNDICFLPKASYGNMTQTEWKTNYPDLVIQICVPLDNPNAYNLEGQEISSYLGDNNIFSDVQGGTTTVEYRADIDLAAT